MMATVFIAVSALSSSAPDAEAQVGGLFQISGKIYDRDETTVYVLGRAIPIDRSGQFEMARVSEFGASVTKEDKSLAVLNPASNDIKGGVVYSGPARFLKRVVGQNRFGGPAPILVYEAVSPERGRGAPNAAPDLPDARSTARQRKAEGTPDSALESGQIFETADLAEIAGRIRTAKCAAETVCATQSPWRIRAIRWTPQGSVAYIVTRWDPAHCGSGGCTDNLVIVEGTTVRVLAAAFGDMEALDSHTRGVRDIAISRKSVGRTIFVWNGTDYRPAK